MLVHLCCVSILVWLPVLVAASPSCHGLSKLVPGSVFYANGTEYETSMLGLFYLSQRVETPACIVEPSSAKDVARIVKYLGNGKRKTTLAVRSGGHSSNPGFSSTDDGITMDLRQLDTVNVKEGSVSVGGGVRFQDVYHALDQLNRTVVGARAADLGVGGFLSGGGLSFFSPHRGFGCDSIANFEVVLADGTIVNANAGSHADLFRALKGGQSNFGIITRMDIVTYKQDPYWGGAVFYSAAADQSQLDAFDEFRSSPYDGFAEVEQSFLYYGSRKMYLSSNNMYYTRKVANINDTVLGPFFRAQPQTSNTIRLSNTSDFATEIKDSQPVNQFASYSTFTFPLSKGALNTVYSQWKRTTASLAESVPEILSVMTFQGIPPPPAADKPQNSMGFAPGSTPEKDHVLVLFSLYWPSDGDSSTVRSAAKDLTRTAEGLVGSRNGFEYLNYAASWQDPLRRYGAASFERLIEASKKYDPTGFFQNVVSGGFKLDPRSKAVDAS